MEYIIDLGREAISVMKDTDGRVWLSLFNNETHGTWSLGLEGSEALRVRDAIDEVLKNG